VIKRVRKDLIFETLTKILYCTKGAGENPEGPGESGVKLSNFRQKSYIHTFQSNCHGIEESVVTSMIDGSSRRNGISALITKEICAIRQARSNSSAPRS
jgi:hypothetical protein